MKLSHALLAVAISCAEAISQDTCEYILHRAQLTFSVSVPDSIFRKDDSVPVGLCIKNEGREEILIEDTALSPRLKKPILSDHKIRFETMFVDIRPEYGVRRLIRVPPGGQMRKTLQIEMRSLPKDTGHPSQDYEVEVWIGYMNSDSILLPLLDKAQEINFIPSKDYARLTELHNTIRLGPLRFTLAVK